MGRVTGSPRADRGTDAARLAAAVEDAIPPAARADWEQHLAGEQVRVGRQSIFTLGMRPFAYQLSCPSEAQRDSVPWTDLEHERATADVLRASFARADLEQVAHGRLLFVRFPRAHLIGTLPVPPHPDRLVIEVSGQVTIDTAVLSGVRRLRERGFRIALPGFISRADQRRLLPHVDFVKLDVRDLDVEGRPVVELARSYGALLIAELVEERRHLEHSAELGLDLAQGDLLEPTTVVDRSAAPMRLAR